MQKITRSAVIGARGSDHYSLAFYTPLDVAALEVIETEAPDGCLISAGTSVVQLEADQMRVLGKFLVEMFMWSAVDTIKQIEERVAFAIGRLEVWNQRARDDEEHPPYDDITTNLHDIQRCLDELKKGIG